MAILTNNPGFIAAALYDSDPNNEQVPDAFHNAYHNGVVSYTLALAAGLPPLFSQDVNGLVPGPTAGEIAAGGFLKVDGSWAANANGLNGTGVLQAGDDANAGGEKTSASGDQSIAIGFADTVGGVLASGQASSARGLAATATDFIRATQLGATAIGVCSGGGIAEAVQSASFVVAQVFDAVSRARAETSASFVIANLATGGRATGSAQGCLTIARATGTDSLVKSDGDGGITSAIATAGAVVNSSADGSIIVAAADGVGTNVVTSAAGFGSAVFARALAAASVNNEGDGCLLSAYATGAGSIADINNPPANKNFGCAVFGSAAAAGILRVGHATAEVNGAVAIGYANATSIIAEADSAVQVATGVNSIANSLQVGAVASGIHLHADGLPAAPANGDIWNAAGSVFVRTGGVSVDLGVDLGGLNGTGVLQAGTDANAGGTGTGATLSAAGAQSLVLGRAQSSSTILADVNTFGCLVLGYTTSSGIVRATGDRYAAIVAGWADDASSIVEASGGSFAPAFVVGSAQQGCVVRASGTCSWVIGRASGSTGSGRMESSGSGSGIIGTSTSGGVMLATGSGALLGGFANTESQMNANGSGSLCFGATATTNATITALNTASQAMGQVINAGTFAGTILAGVGGGAGDASYARGYVDAVAGITQISTEAFAATAWGYAANAEISAQGQASFASANADGTVDCLATAAGAWQIGPGTNAVANAFQLGAGVLNVEFDSVSPKLGVFAATPVVQQVHVADPTDLAECITAITALNAMCAAYGLTAAA